MGLNVVATLAAAVALATPAGYVAGQQRDDGGFGDAQLTAWATLGLAAAGADATTLDRAAAYLAKQDPREPTEVALVAMARTVAGDRPEALLARLRAHRPGKLLNATIWTILALRQAGEPAPPALVRSLLAAQRSSGGWSWHVASAPDTNDTAAAIQALRAAGVGGRPIDRAVAFLRRHQNRDGGFELSAGRGSDAQSTAWAIQALLAAQTSARRCRLPLSRPPAPLRRQLPLLGALRDDAALGHGPGAAGPCPQAVPARCEDGVKSEQPTEPPGAHGANQGHTTLEGTS